LSKEKADEAALEAIQQGSDNLMDEVAALREQLETTLATLEQSMEGLADAAPGAKKEEGGRRQTIKKKLESKLRVAG
jgi:phage shock protein A